MLKLIPILTAALAAFSATSYLQEPIKLFDAGQFGDAETKLETIVSQHPDDAAAHAWLAMARLSREKTGEAKPEVEKAVDLKADSVESQAARAWLAVQEKNFDAAGQALAKAAEMEEDSVLVPYVKGLMLVEKKDWSPAAEEFDRAIERNPHLAFAYYYSGIAYSRVNRQDKMVERFQTFMKLAPKTPEARKVQSLLRAVR